MDGKRRLRTELRENARKRSLFVNKSPTDFAGRGRSGLPSRNFLVHPVSFTERGSPRRTKAAARLHPQSERARP